MSRKSLRRKQPKTSKAGAPKRPTLEETLKMADKFWSTVGHLTGFPSRESYLLFVKDFFNNKVSKMTDEEYTNFVNAQQADVVKRLQGVASYIETRLKK